MPVDLQALAGLVGANALGLLALLAFAGRYLWDHYRSPNEQLKAARADDDRHMAALSDALDAQIANDQHNRLSLQQAQLALDKAHEMIQKLQLQVETTLQETERLEAVCRELRSANEALTRQNALLRAILQRVSPETELPPQVVANGHDA